MTEFKVGRPLDCPSKGGQKDICVYDRISTDIGPLTEAFVDDGEGTIAEHHCSTCRSDLSVISKGVGNLSVLSTPELGRYL